MIRRGKLLAAVALAAAAVALYQIKYEVAALEDRALALAQDLDGERQALHVLNAEWAYLNDPERLAALVDRHLDLVPLDADRIVAADDLPLFVPADANVAEMAPDSGDTP